MGAKRCELCVGRSEHLADTACAFCGKLRCSQQLTCDCESTKDLMSITEQALVVYRNLENHICEMEGMFNGKQVQRPYVYVCFLCGVTFCDLCAAEFELEDTKDVAQLYQVLANPDSFGVRLRQISSIGEATPGEFRILDQQLEKLLSNIHTIMVCEKHGNKPTQLLLTSSTGWEPSVGLETSLTPAESKTALVLGKEMRTKFQNIAERRRQHLAAIDEERRREEKVGVVHAVYDRYAIPAPAQPTLPSQRIRRSGGTSPEITSSRVVATGTRTEDARNRQILLAIAILFAILIAALLSVWLQVNGVSIQEALHFLGRVVMAILICAWVAAFLIALYFWIDNNT